MARKEFAKEARLLAWYFLNFDDSKALDAVDFPEKATKRGGFVNRDVTCNRLSSSVASMYMLLQADIYRYKISISAIPDCYSKNSKYLWKKQR